jgi:hypothetical protein
MTNAGTFWLLIFVRIVTTDGCVCCFVVDSGVRSATAAWHEMREEEQNKKKNRLKLHVIRVIIWDEVRTNVKLISLFDKARRRDETQDG